MAKSPKRFVSMTSKNSFLLIVAAITCPPAALAASHMNTIGRYYYKSDPIYNKEKCSRVNALLASRLTARYTCSNIDLSPGLGTCCSSADGPEVVIFDTLDACEQNRGLRTTVK